MRVVWIASAIAVALALAYALLISPAFEPYWDDQVAYLRLAHGLVARGEYTRADVGAAFAPEPLWPPGYPLFLAPLCLAGCSHWLVAIAQAALYGVLVVLSYFLAAATIGARRARLAAVLVGVYLPLAYWSAIAYADFLAVFLLVAALAAFLRARASDSLRWAFASGCLLGWLALTRPVYFLFPAALVCVVLVVDGRRIVARARLIPLLALLASFVLVVAPLFAYSQRYFSQPFLSSSGVQLWLGVGQGLARSDLDAFETREVAQVDAELAAFGRITDRVDQAYAWVSLNASLGQHALRWIEHDPTGYLARAPLRAFTLWADDLPVPVAAAPSLSTELRVVVATVELVLMLFGIVGAVALARRRTDAGLLPLVVILYLTLTLTPLWTQSRYSLGAKPLVLTAAVAGVALLRRTRATAVYSPTNR